MSEEEKKAIELLKQPPDFSLRYYERENAIDIVLNLIEKQNKVIDKMAEELQRIQANDNDATFMELSENVSIKEIEDYFKNLVEKENK